MSAATPRSALTRGGAPVVRAALVATALAFTGCSETVGPDLGRVPIEPPTLYRTWWGTVEECSSLQGSFEGVRWFAVHEFGDGPGILGQWNERREITVRSDVWLDEQVVRHEILHDLLRGDRNHERPEWGLCGLELGVPEGTPPGP